MKNKLLYITSLSGKRINGFMLSSILAAKKAGFDFHIASNENGADPLYYKDCESLGITPHHINFKRSPLHPTNIKAYKELNDLINKEKYDIVHCNTPIGGVLGRIAAKKANIKRVIYMAHGFHFWKGAPIKNWVLYYSVERLLARYTDLLITINEEDFSRAKKFRAKNVVYVPGVGINTKSFGLEKVDFDKKRKELGISNNSFVILSVGELSERKKHAVIIKALAKLHDQDIQYLICGQGKLQNDLVDLTTSLGVEDRVKFLGFRTDISEICRVADTFVFPSKQEGLPIALMEAMAVGLPVVCSKIRGNVDLVSDGEGGFLVDATDETGYVKSINNLIKDSELRTEMGRKNIDRIKKFKLENVVMELESLYTEIKVN